MNSSETRTGLQRHIALGFVSGSGVLLAGLHLFHAFTEETTLALLFGGLFPFLAALAVAIGGYVVWKSDLPTPVTLRSAGWVGLGMGLMSLFGGGAILYEYAEGARLFDEGYVVLTFVTFGAATGLLLGWHDARRLVLTSQLRAKKRELTQQNERLEGFANVISHDLRNPLNVATGRLDLIDADEDSEHREAVRQAHTRMEALIEDLLTLARHGQTVGTTTPVAVQEVASEAWTQVSTDDTSLEIALDMVIEADASQLQQLFENLYRNAIEHGGDDVTVRVGSLDDSAGFYVADDGHGIPPDDRERIFEYGYSTDSGGTGLGLGIVQQIVQAHGWTITATQAAIGGAKFEIRGVAQVEMGYGEQRNTGPGVASRDDT